MATAAMVIFGAVIGGEGVSGSVLLEQQSRTMTYGKVSNVHSKTLLLC